MSDIPVPPAPMASETSAPATPPVATPPSPGIAGEWKPFFDQHHSLLRSIASELQSCAESKQVVYPCKEDIFRCFALAPAKIRVVILGQDPYHNGAAMGLCFSVKGGGKLNPSLINILKEIDNPSLQAQKGDLSHWADQGCFMLNRALTVIEGRPESHLKLWNKFTESVILYLANTYPEIVWLLMGSKAQDVTLPKNARVVMTSHPSPLGASQSMIRGGRLVPAFRGSKAFATVNGMLATPIKW